MSAGKGIGFFLRTRFRIGRAKPNAVFSLIFIKEAEIWPNEQWFTSTSYTLTFEIFKSMSMLLTNALNEKSELTVIAAAFSLIPGAV